MTGASLFQPLELSCGLTLVNRIAKAAMEESLADADHAPGASLQRLYATWAKGAAGLLVTGNVMIDRRAMTGPCGVVLEDAGHLDRFRAWAQACHVGGAKVLMQINHPGRQVMTAMGQEAIAPSSVAVAIAGMKGMFPTPRAMTETDVTEVIERFATTAALAEQAGFDGVQIHAAHGYLLSQFLSPLSNRRNDRWGGSLKNRARILVAVVQAVRQRVAPDFCVAVKLNSADFQRGGFDTRDAGQVIRILNDEPIDLVELSGGSYESPAMRGLAADGRTLAREAHFLEFAKEIVREAHMPIMLTGGIGNRKVAERVLDDGIALVGMATALARDPDLPKRWQGGEDVDFDPIVLPWKSKAMAATAVSAMVKRQLARLSQGKQPGQKLSPVFSMICDQVRSRSQTKRYRQWIARTERN